MATLTVLKVFMLISAFTETTSITSEDALAAQRLYEHAPPELQEVIQQLLQEPDLDEEAEQVLQQPRTELDSQETEDVEEEEPAEDMASDDEPAQDSEEVEEEDGTREQEANDEEEAFEVTIPGMVVEESEDFSDTHGDETLDATDAAGNGMGIFGTMELDSSMEHLESPWAFVSYMQAEGIPPEIVEEVVAGVVDSIKQDVEVQSKEEESGELLVAAEMKLQLPHVGEVGAKNTEPHDVEPLMIRDAADERATTSISERALLQLNQFSFHGNVLNGSKNVEDMGAHWIVQFCPHWWEPCEGLTNSFVSVGHKLEEQLNNALFTRNILFATVDCASEKVLCNEQDVQTYPTTRHYYKGEYVAGWFGGQAQHEEFYTKWLMQQAEGITPESPDGYVVGNLTNSTAAAGGSETKQEEQQVIALPAFEEIAVDLLLVAILVALCTRAVVSNARLWQGPTQQQQLQQQQRQVPQLFEPSHPQEQHKMQEQEPLKDVPSDEASFQQSTPRMPAAERHLPSRNGPVKSMEL